MIQKVWPTARPHVPQSRPVRPSLCCTCKRASKCYISKHGKGGWIESCTLYKPHRGSYGD